MSNNKKNDDQIDFGRLDKLIEKYRPISDINTQPESDIEGSTGCAFDMPIGAHDNSLDSSAPTTNTSNVYEHEEKEEESEQGSKNTAPVYNPLLTKKPRLSFWFMFLVAFGIYFTFSIFVSHIILEPLQVIGASMYPTLNASTRSDHEVVDVVYIQKTKQVQKNDIVVFDAIHIAVSGSNYIKRVIATSGDKIQFVRVSEPKLVNSLICQADYCLYLNGNPIDESAYTETPFTMNVGYPNITDVNATEFYKNVISENELIVPDNMIFVMGDNRLNSKDSRDFGFVSVDDIAGKVVVHIPSGDNIIESLIHSIKEDYLF